MTFVCNGWVYLTGSYRDIHRNIYMDKQTGKLFAEWCGNMIEVAWDGDYFNSVEPYGVGIKDSCINVIKGKE